MTLVLWDESVRMAKIKAGINPKSFVRLQGKILKDAQAIYHILLLNHRA
jgi:hypothetical protein